MKITKILMAVLLLSSLLLVGCIKTDKTAETVDVQPVPTPSDEMAEPIDEAAAERARFENMTEEERVQEMIKLIEAEEAKTKGDKTTE
jgi:PBP1b-binding outer membrane lipoprotein LpoB